MRKRKATCRDIPAYYAHARCKANVDNKEVRGTLYKLSNPMELEEKYALLRKFNNLLFCTVKPEFAPEQKHSAVILLDCRISGGVIDP